MVDRVTTPKANLPAGTQIKNTANIYFDFNPAVVTNTTINNFLAPVGVKEINLQEFSVFPSENEFTIKFYKNFSNWYYFTIETMPLNS